jgi:membrane protease YdiL (CAAX protease family)
VTASPPPSGRIDVAAIAIVAGWLLGAALARTVGLWIGLGLPAILLATATVIRCGRDLDGWHVSGRGLALGGVVGVVMTIATLALFEPVTALVPALRTDTAGLYAALGHPRPMTALVLLPLIVICEEIVWRGAVFQALSSRLAWAAAAMTGSLLYAAVHAPIGSPVLLLTCLAAGLCWNALRAWTTSLPAVILAHLIWDASVLILHRVVK